MDGFPDSIDELCEEKTILRAFYAIAFKVSTISCQRQWVGSALTQEKIFVLGTF